MPLRGIEPNLQSLLQRLHEQSLTQENNIPTGQLKNIRSRYAVDLNSAMKDMDKLMVDKFIALDEDKCHFIYNLLLSTGATTIIEAGTSFGVSTIYLALAAARNAAASEKTGIVIGTEKEKSKAEIARAYWKEAGSKVEDLIDLKEGDLNETLVVAMNELKQPVDVLLLDIWPYVALPALKLVMPKMRRGAVVLTDNTLSSAEGYKELFTVLRDPHGPFNSVTLPYPGGLEMSVYNP